MDLFTLEEIEAAVKETNFERALGSDGFDGSILKRDKEI